MLIKNLNISLVDINETFISAAGGEHLEILKWLYSTFNITETI